MFNLEQKVKDLLGNTIYLRGKQYFLQKLVKNINIFNDKEYIDIQAEVQGTSIYETGIGIYKDKELGFSCDCMAFEDVGYCKHCVALAMEVSSKYEITDDLKFIDKKTKKELNLKNENYDYENENILEDFLGNEDFLKNIQGNKNLLKMLGIEDSKLYEKQQKLNNNLSIFSNISNEKYLKNDLEEEQFYKIKLGFIEKSGKIQDIIINLYKCKIQKNGKLSSGAQIKREKSSDLPQKYKLLSPFLESNSGNYYWYQDNSQMTFNTSGKTFISTLFNFDEIFDINNNLINLHKEVYNLKINIEKNNDDYKINLSIVGLKSSYKLAGYKIFGDVGNNYFACLTRDNNLMFFYSELNYFFIKDFSLKKEVILNKLEFEELKKQNYFDYIIENTSDIQNIGIDFLEINPNLGLKVEIPNDYSFVKVEQFIFYDDFEINIKNSQKEIIKTVSGYLKRNLEKELLEFEKLKNIFNIYDEFDGIIGKKYIDENIDNFFDEIEKLVLNGVKVSYNQQAKRISSGELKINLKVNSGVDFFDIESQVMLGDNELKDAKEILSQAKKGAKYITLNNGNVVILKNDILKETKTLDALGISEKDIGKSVKVGKYNIGLLKDEVKKKGFLSFELDKDAKSLKEKFKSFKKIEDLKLIKGSKIILRDYQKTGVNFINFLANYNFSGILADDMGLGKTIQTLAFLETKYLTDKDIGRTLIICPTSLVFNWLDEANKFTPKLKFDYIKTGKTGFLDIDKKTKIIICSYGIISNLAENGNIKEIFEYIILDEAQNIKNPVSARAKSLSELKSKNRLALSGTPIENNLVELWSIFNFLMPGFLGNLNHFKSNYSGDDKETLEILSKKVKPFILRRTKEEVLKDLPPKVEEYIKLEMGEKQKRFYEKLKNTYKAQLTKKLDQEGLNKARFEVLDALLKLRQACLVPELVNLEGANFRDSIKLDYIDENIEEMIGKGHNLLIFSQFTGFLAYVKELLDKKGITYNYLDGQTKAQDRKKLVDSFNSGDVNVFIISLKAGGTGLNLTSADYVIHLDPWWNPAVENQATDRAHRMGQQKTVFVQKLIVSGSIEEKILQLQDSKKKLIDDVFSGNFSGSLDKADIDFIFS